MCLDNPNSDHFSVVDGKLYTAWTMRDGNTMTGTFIQHALLSPSSYTVLRVDGTTCHVPEGECRPATCDDIQAACEFYKK